MYIPKYNLLSPIECYLYVCLQGWLFGIGNKNVASFSLKKTMSPTLSIH